MQVRRNLLKVFTAKDQTFKLSDNRLKASSARDYVRRLTYIFLYAYEIFEFPYPTESAVKTLLQSNKAWDASGNANAWLKKRIKITLEGEDQLKLTAPGREDAVSILNEALDTNIPDKWNPDKNALKQRPARKKKA